MIFWSLTEIGFLADFPSNIAGMGDGMQNRLTATWIIAALLFGAMIVFSFTSSRTMETETGVISDPSRYVIQSNDLSGSTAATDETVTSN